MSKKQSVNHQKNCQSGKCNEKASGGRATNSPPSNVKVNPNLTVKQFSSPTIKVLSSGVDSLDISIQTAWKSTKLFDYLTDLKEKAIDTKSPVSGFLEDTKGVKSHFLLQPYGGGGYSFILIFENRFTVKIMNSLLSKTRPGILVSFRSEYLWTIEPHKAVYSFIELFKNNDASIINVNASRIDLCVDIRLPLSIWNEELKKYAVTRARNINEYFSHMHLSGFTVTVDKELKKTGTRVGKKNISVRLYDKPLEIIQQSKKEWFYPIWGIEKHDLASDEKIIRVEFQLRSDAIRELNKTSIYDFLEETPSLWAYCTQKWLKFQTNPGKHHTQRKTFDWWIKVQNGFMGIQNPTPAIRNKAISIDKKQIFAQLYGCFIALAALTIEGNIDQNSEKVNLNYLFSIFLREMKNNKKYEVDILHDILSKRAKYQRASKDLLFDCAS